MLTWIIGIIVIGGIFYLMMRGGGCCGGHDHGAHQGHGEGDGHGQATHHHHEAKAEENTDPVCGMTVGADGPESSVEGRTYRFCSDSCKSRFDSDPAAYT